MATDAEIAKTPLRTDGPGKGLLVVGVAMLSLGVVMVYSASANVTGSESLLGMMAGRHLAYAVLAAAVMCLLWRVDYHVLTRGGGMGTLTTVLLAAALVLAALVLVPGIGAEVKGARRWYRFQIASVPLSFQPSELVKLATVLALACWLGRPERDVRSFTRAFLPAVAVVAVCVGLVILEDFGTAAVIALTAGAVLLLAGVPWYYLVTLLPAAAAGFYLLVVQVPVRWARIVAFIDPWDQGSRWTYQGRQALIAIGSGGLWGKGLGNGSLKLGYLPEDSTDFIFAVICEELGFVGAAILLGLIAMVLYFAWRAACRSGDKTGRLLAGGMGVLLGLQALLHVAVNIGSAPPTGMNLPLVSAGGTALLVSAVAVAVIVSVATHAPAREDGEP